VPPPIPEDIRLDLLRYLRATSAERAQIIARLHERGSDLAEVLTDLELDDDLRLMFELDLLRTRDA
jgi:hypothetical protein